VYDATSDDQGQIDPVRYYTFAVDTRDGHLDPGDVTFDDVTALQAPNGQPYAPVSLDPEGSRSPAAGASS